jgi:hypothetical protein
MHKYDLADVWVAMATIADDAGSPLITARPAADLAQVSSAGRC